MAKIQLTGGYSPLAEGKYTFTVTSYTYNEDFGKLKFVLTTSEGKKAFNDYTFSKDDQRSINAFSYFAHCCMNDMTLDEIDPEELIGKKVKGTVVHNEGRDGKIFVNIKDWEAVKPSISIDYIDTEDAMDVIDEGSYPNLDDIL